MIAIQTRRLSIKIDGCYIRIGRFSLCMSKDDYRPARFIEVYPNLGKPGNWTAFALGRRFMLGARND